jgi:glycosyltransferase involved in cell wall biosynthesis
MKPDVKGGAYSLGAVREDWHLLDDEAFPEIGSVKLVSHEDFSSTPEIPVRYIEPGPLAALFARVPLLYWFFYAWRLLARGRDAVLIVNGGNALLWFWCGLLRACFFRSSKLFCWDIFVEFILGSEKRVPFLPFLRITTRHKELLARFILSQYELNVLWSAKQVPAHARHFKLPAEKFIFLPFKANHSKNEGFHIDMGNFIFAGGNGKRDYRCLIEAVRGTGIPVIISATDPAVRKTIEQLPNVMVVGAPEPAFGMLQAASRLVVIPMIYSGLKGGGEANFCNAMWHGKPIVAADSIAASDYVVEGETGFVTESGDSHALRERILQLWKDPGLCQEMGRKGRQHVEKYFTHRLFIRRLLRLALICGNHHEPI